MTWPHCAWCGAVLVGQHQGLWRRGSHYALHYRRCANMWIETERALGHELPGETRWHPQKGKRR